MTRIEPPHVPFAFSDTPTHEVQAREAALGGLAEAVRRLADVTVRTHVDNAEIDEVRRSVEALSTRLEAEAHDGPFGVRYNAEGHYWFWGNAATGLANPIAPPMVIDHLETGVAQADLELGAAYEGPPGLLHGGIAALLLDQLMSETACEFRRQVVTGTLTLKFKRATPLGPVRVSCRTVREEGRKVFVVGELCDANGVTIEAEAVFLVLGT